jgi:uncharacterized DUF497 family protein
MRINWDPAKNRVNRREHRMSFEDAAELFRSGADYLEIYVEEHSDEEDRFVAVGRIQPGVVVVVFAEHEGDLVRILSARMVTPKERRRFEEFERKGHERRDS